MKRLLIHLCFWGLVSPAVSQDLTITDQLTLKEVFDVGFRPYHLTDEGISQIRQWEPSTVRLKFGDYVREFDARHTTFSVYDDGQIRRLEVDGGGRPLTMEEGVTAVNAILSGLGMPGSEVSEWEEDVLKTGEQRRFSTRRAWRPGVKVGVELLSSLQPIREKPVLLNLSISWDYQRTGSHGGGRLKPIVAPAGYDWDMSFRAWSDKQRGKGSRGVVHHPFAIGIAWMKERWLFALAAIPLIAGAGWLARRMTR